MSIFGYQTKEESSYKKLPSLRQYLKENGSRRIPTVYEVRTIFRPGKWDNWTFDTDKFRLRITPANDLYDDLQGAIETEIVEGNLLLTIVLSEDKNGEFSFGFDKGSIAYWEEIGEIGYRLKECKPNNSKSRKSKTTSPRTRSTEKEGGVETA